MVESPFEASATGRAMAKGRSLSQFQEMFPDEASCAAFLSKRRWSGGFVCPRCGGRRMAALKSRAHTCECLDCGRQTSATAGTVMHRSKLPLTTWFWAAHLMATHSNGMSARQLEDQLGVTYKTAWLLTQKLRRSMVDPDREPLEGVVEVDRTEIPFREGDGFFEPGKWRQDSRHWGRRDDRSRHQSVQAATQGVYLFFPRLHIYNPYYQVENVLMLCASVVIAEGIFQRGHFLLAACRTQMLSH